MEAGIIGYCNALNPLVTNLIALKKNASDLRIVADMRLCNYFTKRTKNHFQSLPDTIRNINLTSTFFSQMDFSQSYYAIPLHPDSTRYCSFFNTEDKLCCLLRTPQGAVDANIHLANVLEQILPKQENLNHYQDDILLSHENDEPQSLDDLLGILSRIYDSGLKLNPKKSHFSRFCNIPRIPFERRYN